MNDPKAHIFLIPGGEAAEVVELVEAAYEAVALFLELAVILSRPLAIAFGRNHDLCAWTRRPRHQSICIVAAVDDDSFGTLSVGRFYCRSISAILS